ncbi:MAG TPA: condensation domain-containing protein, partial [Chloroflexota bacterium]|nr:condensation domain-containing protein [Chloroflexota bacterium]
STRTGSRKRPELAGLLGYFVSTPPIRTDLAGDPPFTDFLRRVRQSTVDALAHDEVPFGYFAQDLRPRSAGGHGPFGQVMLTFEPSLPALPSGWTLTQLEVEIDAMEADLFIELDDRPQGVIGCFEYNCALFDAATISRMVDQWQTLLESIVADPTRRLSQLAKGART